MCVCTHPPKVLPFARTWVDIEGVTLSEVSQRDTIGLHYIWNLKNKLKIQRPNWWLWSWGGGWGKEIQGIKVQTSSYKITPEKYNKGNIVRL